MPFPGVRLKQNSFCCLLVCRLLDSFNKITIKQAHSIPWFERRHHLALAWLIRFCRRLLFPLLSEYFCHLRTFIWVVKISRIPDRQAQIPHLCPNFGKSRFPGSSQIPNPVKIFCVFPNPVRYFAQIPDPANTLPDPDCWNCKIKIPIEIAPGRIDSKLKSENFSLNNLFRV